MYGGARAVNPTNDCEPLKNWGFLVPGGGIEPPQAFWALRILSPLRLPISPSRLDPHSSLAAASQSLSSTARQATLEEVAFRELLIQK